jgi:hypothetical protein
MAEHAKVFAIMETGELRVAAELAGALHDANR